MFRHIVQHVTGMVRTLRQRFQTSSGPAEGKTYRHVIHEEADETEAIACTGGEESLARMSGVS
jgi:hypothetical protein